MPVEMQTLMDEAKCYMCFGPLTSAQMLTLATVRRWLISVDSSADTSPQALVEYSECYACLGNLSMYELMMLALLDQIAQAT